MRLFLHRNTLRRLGHNLHRYLQHHAFTAAAIGVGRGHKLLRFEWRCSLRFSWERSGTTYKVASQDVCLPQCGRAAHLAFEEVPPCQVISLPKARDDTRSSIGDEVHWLTSSRVVPCRGAA